VDCDRAKIHDHEIRLRAGNDTANIGGIADRRDVAHRRVVIERQAVIPRRGQSSGNRKSGCRRVNALATRYAGYVEARASAQTELVLDRQSATRVKVWSGKHERIASQVQCTGQLRWRVVHLIQHSSGRAAVVAVEG